jgi:hypothetical protein
VGDPTAAEIEAGTAAVRDLEDVTTDRYLTTSDEVAAVLRAVLPGRDAQVRAEVVEEIAADFAAHCQCPQWSSSVCAHDIAAAVVREHTTGGDHD